MEKYPLKLWLMIGAIFCLLANNKNVDAQNHDGNFIIKNFKTSDYKGHSQNWDAVQDFRGIMYFANGDGVLEYDGVNWRTITISNESTVRSLAIDDNNNIFVGATDDFGFLKPNSIGLLVYESLLNRLQTPQETFGAVNQILVVNKQIFFVTDHKLFRFNYKTIQTTFSANEIKHAFIQKDKLYLILENKGVVKYEENTLIPVIADSKIGAYNVQFDIPIHRNKSLIGTRRAGLFSISPENVLSSNSFNTFSTNRDNFLYDNDLYCGNRLNSNQFIVGSSFGGAKIFNVNGQFVQSINQANGLLDNDICKIVKDKHDNLWFCLNRGISYVETSGALTYWNEFSGIKGAIEKITEFNNMVVIATHQGVFYKEKNTEQFVKLKQLNGQSWYLSEIRVKNKDLLLIASNSGLWYWNGQKNEPPQKLNFDETTFVIHKSQQQPNQLILGCKEGAFWANTQHFPTLEITKIPGVKDNIRSIAEENENIWLCSYRNGVIKTKRTKRTKNSPIKYYGQKQGFKSLKNIRVFSLNNRLLFVSSKGIYEYRADTDSFVVYNGFNRFFNHPNVSVYDVATDKQNRYWFTANANHLYQVTSLQKNVLDPNEWVQKQVAQLPEMMILDLYTDKNNELWIGGTDGLFKYNANLEKVKIPYNTLIRKVTLNQDSLIFGGTFFSPENSFAAIQIEQPKHLIPLIKNQFSNIAFNYTATFFENSPNVVYSYKMEGLEKQWSEYNKHTSVSYSNLTAGNYTFKVKSKNAYGTISSVASYSFIISKAWYQSVFFYLFAIVGFIGVIYLLFKLYASNLKRKNDLLESEIKHRTAEINNQNIAISEQQHVLKQQNEDLEKLKIAVDNSSNAISILDKSGKFIWINNAYFQLYGKSLSTLQDQCETIFECNLSDDATNEIFMATQLKQTRQFEQYIERDKDENLWISTTVSPIVDDNQKLQALVFIDTDISSLKKAEHRIYQAQEEILSQSELLQRINAELSLLSIVATKTNNSIFILDNEFKLEWVNESFLKIRNIPSYKERNQKGISVFEIYSKPDIIAQIKLAAQQKKPTSFEYLLTTDNLNKWLRVDLTPVLEDDMFLSKTIVIESDFTQQKEIETALSRQNNETLESLEYAAGIQKSMLSSQKLLKNYFVEHFIFFKPKDVVSGDFYWFAEKNNKLIMVAADCTGHGIPGALMSMLGISMLQSIVDNTTDISPNAILDKLRIRVIQSLNQQENSTETRDGMDISICVIDKKNKIIQYSGANNPIYIIRDKSIRIIKADRMPVGIHTKANVPFSVQMFKLQHNDTIYMFSDGYADQFGGTEKKKFLTKRFKQLLVDIHEYPMSEQQKLLHTNLINWQGKMIQIDDILIVGVRF